MLFCSIDVMIQFRMKEESYRSYLSVLNSFSGSLEARKTAELPGVSSRVKQ